MPLRKSSPEFDLFLKGHAIIVAALVEEKPVPPAASGARMHMGISLVSVPKITYQGPTSMEKLLENLERKTA